jgi:hypothetical protein
MTDLLQAGQDLLLALVELVMVKEILVGWVEQSRLRL